VHCPVIDNTEHLSNPAVSHPALRCALLANVQQTSCCHTSLAPSGWGQWLNRAVCLALSVCVRAQVCLSLLGTWAGPSWEPGVSTLLQVRHARTVTLSHKP
jgi:hypothetical protein